MSRQLFCGAAKEKITPPDDMIGNLSGLMNSQFGGVVDDLYVRVIALKDDQKMVLLVSFDLDKAACPQENMEALEKATGVSGDSILFIGIHTHSAPITGDRPYEGPNYIARKPVIVQETTKRYEAFVRKQLLAAAEKAIGQMVPAEAGYQYGESHINVNRVAFYEVEDADGNVSTKIGTGTNYEREADPKLFVVKFRDMEGKPIAFFINYACHNTVMILNKCGKDGKVGISSDMGGNVSKCMEDFYDGSVAMWSSGAAGDINPIMSNQVYREDSVTGAPIEVYEENGEIALSMLRTLTAHHFADVKKVVRRIRDYESDIRLSAGEQWAEVPGKDENGDPIPYKVRVHKIQIGPVVLMGFSGELYSALGKELKTDLYEGPLILINHDASLLFNSGYIFSDEAFELAQEYDADIVGMNHTWLQPGCIAAELRRCMKQMLDQE